MYARLVDNHCSSDYAVFDGFDGKGAIPTSALLPLMRWLNPADHPRILIGVQE